MPAGVDGQEVAVGRPPRRQGSSRRGGPSNRTRVSVPRDRHRILWANAGSKSLEWVMLCGGVAVVCGLVLGDVETSIGDVGPWFNCRLSHLPDLTAECREASATPPDQRASADERTEELRLGRVLAGLASADLLDTPKTGTSFDRSRDVRVASNAIGAGIVQQRHSRVLEGRMPFYNSEGLLVGHDGEWEQAELRLTSRIESSGASPPEVEDRSRRIMRNNVFVSGIMEGSGVVVGEKGRTFVLSAGHNAKDRTPQPPPAFSIVDGQLALNETESEAPAQPEIRVANGFFDLRSSRVILHEGYEITGEDEQMSVARAVATDLSLIEVDPRDLESAGVDRPWTTGEMDSVHETASADQTASADETASVEQRRAIGVGFAAIRTVVDPLKPPYDYQGPAAQRKEAGSWLGGPLVTYPELFRSNVVSHEYFIGNGGAGGDLRIREVEASGTQAASPLYQATTGEGMWNVNAHSGAALISEDGTTLLGLVFAVAGGDVDLYHHRLEFTRSAIEAFEKWGVDAEKYASGEQVKELFAIRSINRYASSFAYPYNRGDSYRLRVLHAPIAKILGLRYRKEGDRNVRVGDVVGPWVDAVDPHSLPGRLEKALKHLRSEEQILLHALESDSPRLIYIPGDMIAEWIRSVVDETDTTEVQEPTRDESGLGDPALHPAAQDDNREG